jgi:hypothetical protein
MSQRKSKNYRAAQSIEKQMRRIQTAKSRSVLERSGGLVHRRELTRAEEKSVMGEIAHIGLELGAELIEQRLKSRGVKI